MVGQYPEPSPAVDLHPVGPRSIRGEREFFPLRLGHYLPVADESDLPPQGELHPQPHPTGYGNTFPHGSPPFIPLGPKTEPPGIAPPVVGDETVAGGQGPVKGRFVPPDVPVQGSVHQEVGPYGPK